MTQFETMTLPSTLRAGDTLALRLTFHEYPAGAGWQLALRLINADGHIDLAAVADGDGYRLDAPAAVTSTWAAGRYDAIAVFSRAGERVTLPAGFVTILPDLAAATGGMDTRGAARRALDQLRSALATYLASNGQVAEFEIEGRRLRYRSVGELRAAIDLIEREVAREDAARGISRDTGGKAMVRF